MLPISAVKIISILLLSLGTSLTAFAAPKIAVFDFNDVVRKHHIAWQFRQDINELTESIKKDPRIAAQRQLAEKRDQLIAEAKDPNLDEAKRQELSQQMETLRDQHQELVIELRRLSLEHQGKLSELRYQHTDALRKHIDEIASNYAAENGFDWLIDTSGQTNSRLPLFLYIKDSTDITEALIPLVNKDAPAEFHAATLPEGTELPGDAELEAIVPTVPGAEAEEEEAAPTE